MNFLSWKVRGLESPDRKFVIKRFLSSFNSMDFLMLQEDKAIGFMLETNLNFIWNNAIKFCTNHNRGRGGIALLTSPKWGNYITANGTSPC